jgi:hypothetical protein
MNAITLPAQLAAAPRGTVRPQPSHFFDGTVPADAYGCPLHGDCLSPDIKDGDMALASPSAEARPGDFVVLYFASGAPPQIKRLVMAPGVPVGTKLHPDSDVQFLVVVEMLNPPRQLMAPIDRLTAMHKVVGLIRKDEVAALRNLPPLPAAAIKPARRRKAGAA